MRPIDAWPPKTARMGRPGYSHRHFAMLAEPSSDPLRVAERIASRIDSDHITTESAARIARGESMAAVLEWQRAELVATGNARWARLSSSFDAVIDVLEAAEQSAAIRSLVREAKRARRRSA